MAANKSKNKPQRKSSFENSIFGGHYKAYVGGDYPKEEEAAKKIIHEYRSVLADTAELQSQVAFFDFCVVSISRKILSCV